MKHQLFRSGCLGILCLVVLFVATVRPANALTSRPLKREGPARVYVTVFILDVDEIHTAAQSFDANVYLQLRWHDPRLKHDGEGEIFRSVFDVWNPRVQMVNQQRVLSTFPEIVEISPDGEVVYRQRFWGSFSQPLKLQDFPFDQQIFTIQLAAAGYTPDEVELVADPSSASGKSDHFSVPDWKVTNWKIESGSFRSIQNEEATAGFALHFEADRETGYFVVKVIIPLVLIVAMSWVVFWIDPRELGTQISVVITAMLTLIAYRFAVGTALPRISYLTRLDDFILSSTVLVYASLVQVVITSSYAKSGKLKLARSIDKWSRFLFPAAFALMALDTLLLRVFR